MSEHSEACDDATTTTPTTVIAEGSQGGERGTPTSG